MRRFSIHSYRSLFRMYGKHFSPWTVAGVRCMVLALIGLQWLGNLVAGCFSNSPVCKRNREDLRNVIRLCLERPRTQPWQIQP